MRVERDDGGIQVMEHREPPRIGAGDRRGGGGVEGADGPVPVPLRAFDPFRNRTRVVSVRVAVTAVAALGVAALLVYVGSRATGGAVAWLHRQPKYQLAFDDVHLVHELPGWYRGGKREFLARVRRSSGNPARISQLEVRPDRIATAFKLDPWVEEVVKVTYAPGRIAVDLRFREPVAWVKLEGGQQQIVDGQGRLLPTEDVDVELVSPVIKITGGGSALTPPADPRAGVVWKSKAGGADPDRVDERIVAAAGLARFLRQHLQTEGAGGSKALRMDEIMLADPKDFGNHSLFMVNAEGTLFWWGSAPGSETGREPSAHEKWQMLLRWDETVPREAVAEGDYLAFSAKGLSQLCPHRKGPHRRRDGGRPAP
jgi:hypothetical protein